MIEDHRSAKRNLLLTIAIFATAGFFSAGLTFAAPMLLGLRQEILGSILYGFAVVPSVPFSLAAGLAALLVLKRRLVPDKKKVSLRRGLAALALLALIYPVGLSFMIATVLSAVPPSYSDNPNPPQLSWVEDLLEQSAIPAAFLLGGLITIAMAARAVQVATGRFPRKVAPWGLAICIGVPACTLGLGYLRSLVSPEFNNGLLFELRAGSFGGFVMLLVGMPVLGALIGYWFYGALADSSASPS